MAKEYKMTEAMRDSLLKEREYLEDVKMKEHAEEINAARSFGDISENSEYDEAMNAQAQTKARILEICEKLEHAVIISEEVSEEMEGVVGLGCTVKVLDLEFDEEDVYCIVGSQEANPMEARISDESPMGRALMGKRVGDIAEYEAPCGTVRYEILGVER